MKINLKDHSVLSLLIANLFPIIGVLFLKWDVFEVVMLYVFETIIVGSYNVLKMLYVKGEKKSFTIFFFIIHYNFFILIQSIFVIVLVGGNNAGDMGPDVGQGFHNLINLFSNSDFKIGLLAMFISQGIAVYKNFIKPKLYQHADLEKLMMEPYKRIFVQQFMAIGGSMIMMSVQAPVGFLIILIIMKTFFDLRAYYKVHHNKAHYLDKNQ